MMLFTAFAAVICVLSIASPSVKTAPVASTTLPAKKVMILPVILSGYATINQGTSHITAVSLIARIRATDGLLDHVYPTLRYIPVSGNTVTPDPEQILRLKPDVLFVYAGEADFLKKLELPGLMAVSVDSQKPIQSRNRIWRQMGDTAGKSSRATALMERYFSKLEVITKELPVGRQVRVAYVHLQNGSWFTTDGNYYIAYKLEMAGAINASKNLKSTGRADLEQLLLVDPDVILFAANAGDTTTMREIAERPELQTLRAVRERRIYKLPEHSYMNELVEDPLLLTWMAEVFYPDVMPCKLRNEYKKTYQEVYHYIISDDEIDRAIYLEENRYSAGYGRFER
jgi:iron complex transport system substrate-binding protein